MKTKAILLARLLNGKEALVSYIDDNDEPRSFRFKFNETFVLGFYHDFEFHAGACGDDDDLSLVISRKGTDYIFDDPSLLLGMMELGLDTPFLSLTPSDL